MSHGDRYPFPKLDNLKYSLNGSARPDAYVLVRYNTRNSVLWRDKGTLVPLIAFREFRAGFRAFGYVLMISLGRVIFYEKFNSQICA